MKVIRDVHIPLKLVNFLAKNGVIAEHVNNLPDGFYSTDSAITNYADKNGLVVITKDIDFRNSYFIQKSPQKLIRVCLGNITTAELIGIFEKQLDFLIRTYQEHPNFYIEINKENTLSISL